MVNTQYKQSPKEIQIIKTIVKKIELQFFEELFTMWTEKLLDTHLNLLYG